MPRNFLFLLDVSDNTRHEVKKFEMTSAALKKFIGTLEVQDTFSIQTFAHEGTMDVWGPNQGTEDEKQDAINYLHSLKPDEDSYAQSMLRVQGGVFQGQGFIDHLMSWPETRDTKTRR